MDPSYCIAKVLLLFSITYLVYSYNAGTILEYCLPMANSAPIYPQRMSNSFRSLAEEKASDSEITKPKVNDTVESSFQKERSLTYSLHFERIRRSVLM